MDSPIGCQVMANLSSDRANIRANIGDNIRDNIWDNILDNIGANIRAIQIKRAWENVRKCEELFNDAKSTGDIVTGKQIGRASCRERV